MTPSEARLEMQITALREELEACRSAIRSLTRDARRSTEAIQQSLDLLFGVEDDAEHVIQLHTRDLAAYYRNTVQVLQKVHGILLAAANEKLP
jgi:deferrochelatase/peroxidase EfeB